MRFGVRLFLRVGANDADKELGRSNATLPFLSANRPAIPLLAGIEYFDSLLPESRAIPSD